MKKVICRSVLFGILSLMGFLNALAETTITDVLPKGATTLFNAKYQYGEVSDDAWPGDPANDVNNKSWYDKDFDDSSWATKPVPFGDNLSGEQKWEGDYNCYWLRINFNIDEVDNTATYYFLCRHDDTYKAYINGNLIADRNGWTGDGYCYVPISGNYLSAGTNVIAVYIQQNYGGSYFDCGVQKYNYQSEDFDRRFIGAEVTDGEFYLYNPASRLWLQNNDRIRSDWNTRAELGTRGLDFTLTKQENGGYYLNGKFNAANCPSIQAGNRYLDTNSADAWHFEKVNVPGLTNAYKVTYWPTDQNDYTLTAKSQSPTPSTNLFTPTVNNDIFLDCFRTGINDYSIWVLVTKEQRLAMMLSDTESSPQNATWLIKNADLADVDDRANAWEKTGEFTYNGRNNDDNTRFGRVYESYNTENVEFSQTINNLPAGKYRMRVQGFYRGGEAKMFAGSTEQPMLSETTTNDMWTVARDMYYNGKYIGDWMEFTHNGGDLKLGIKKGAKATDTDWIIFSKFALEYMGTEGLSNLPLSFYAYNGNNRFSNNGFYSNMLDGNLDTKWEAWPNWDNGTQYGFNDDNGNVLFMASEPIYVNGLTLYTAGDTQTYPARNPYEWTFYGTNDVNVAFGPLDDLEHSGWNVIEHVRHAQLPTENKTGRYYKFNPSQTAYKYFRLHVNCLVGKDELQLAELELDYSMEAKAPITVVADGGGYGGQGANNIFDGPSSTKWCRWNDGNKWVVFKTAKPIYASNYILQTADDAENRDPKVFKLYAALYDAPTTDGSTDGWAEIDSETDASSVIPTDRYAFAEFTIDKPGIYQYFMLKVDETRGTDGSFQLSELILDDEGYAVITCDEDMAEFVNRVNSGNTSLNAFLMADVNSNTSAGTTVNKYTGVFDGMGHVVTLNITSDQEYQGLIGCATGGAVIKNVITRGSVNGASRCGGILGGSQGGGSISILNCGNEADITTTGVNAGGVHGCNNGSGVTYTLTNCYNTGTVTGSNESAGLSGWLGENATVTNCYNIGDVTGIDGSNRSFARWGSGVYTKCYNKLSAGPIAGRTDNYSVYKVRSGELCMALGEPFTQDLSQDCHPTFGSKTVTAGKWFNDTENDVYYNLEGDNYTVYQLNINEENTKYAVPANVTAKNINIARTITSNKWVGLCLPFDSDIPNGWDVLEMTRVNGSDGSATMVFSPAANIVAGKPYIVKTEADVTTITAEGKAITTGITNLSYNGITMIGNFNKTSIPKGSYYISTDGTLKKLIAETANLKGFRAYFTVDEASGIKALNLGIENDATGISSVDANESEAIYNIAGQRLTRVQKGINIVNGKKVLY